MRPRRLLTVSHSYVVALNRRLADEMARAGEGRWEVTAVAPSFFHGDLRDITLEPIQGERNGLIALPAHLSRSPHLFVFSPQLRQIARQGWDLVHAWEEPYVLAGGQVAWSLDARTPLVVVTAQSLSKRYPPPFGSIERWTVARASGCIALGHTVAANLSTRPMYQGKPVRVIGMGVDVDRFRPMPEARQRTLGELDWSEGPPVVGYLGRFVPEKGLPVLLSALSRVRLPWRALFVGGGPLLGRLEAFAREWPGRVRIVSGVKHEDVPRYLNAMDVLCAPSQTTRRWKEQFGRMIIEAFACGVPVIGSDSGEVPHTLGGAGMVVPESDEVGWASALEALLDSPARRRELAQQGRARAESTFAWSVVARHHLTFFEELLPV